MAFSPIFSLIVPVYNAEKYLRDTLNSILLQTYENFEVLMVDDGSTDKSALICEEYASNDVRFHFIHKNNGGVCSARNLGLEHVSGRYVLFIDSDDTIDKNLLEQCYMYLQESAADILIFGMYFDIEKNGQIVRRICKSNRSLLFLACQMNEFYRELYRSNYLTSMCNKVVDVRLIKDNGLRFDERITNYEDLLFSLKCLSKCSKIQTVETCFYHYFLREELGMSRKYKSGLSGTLETTVLELNKAIVNLPLNDEVKKWALTDLQRILWLGIANICRGKFKLLEARSRVKELCTAEWVKENLLLSKTGNRYSDMCIVLYENNMWFSMTLLNRCVNYLRDKKY